MSAHATTVDVATLPPKKKAIPFTAEIIISGCAGAISKTVAAPAERVKLILQSQTLLVLNGRLSQPYRGMTDCFFGTIRHEGFCSLWKGNWANVLRYIPTQGLNFAFHGHFRTLLDAGKSKRNPNESTPILERVIDSARGYAAGSFAGVSSLAFTYTLDCARTRLANDVISNPQGKRQFRSLYDVYAQTYRTDGIVGLHRGFCVSFVSVFAYRGLYFGLYDALKSYVHSEAEASALNMLLRNFLLGWLATCAAGYVIYPLDTVRRRMMMSSGNKGVDVYRRSYSCLRHVIRTEGFMSLMKGAGANVIRGMAGGGVLAGVDYLNNLYLTYWA